MVYGINYIYKLRIRLMPADVTFYYMYDVCPFHLFLVLVYDVGCVDLLVSSLVLMSHQLHRVR